MRARSILLLVLAFLALFLAGWKLYLSYTAVQVEAGFGYDDRGKFIALSFSRPVYLEKVMVGEEELIVQERVGLSHTLRHNWQPKEEYPLRLTYGRGSSLLRARAPALESTLRGEARFYRASYAGETLAVAEVNVFSVENEGVRAYLSPAGGGGERVSILRYPVVFTSQGGYEEFVKKLEEELKRAGFRVRVVKKLEDAEGLLVMANGAWPEGLSTSNRSVYVGAPPGEVLVRRDGSLALGEVWEGTVVSTSMVDSELGLKLKSSSYSMPVGADALDYRTDGMPAIYRLGNTLVFSNTLDRGWDSPVDAVSDVVEAVVTTGFTAWAKEGYEFQGDASNLTALMHARLRDYDRWAVTLLSEKLGMRITGELEGGGARLEGPAMVYPGEEAEFKALIPGEHGELELSITGAGGLGRGVVEEASTRGLEARRIRAVLPEGGLYLLKLLNGGEVVGSALVRAKAISVQAVSIRTGQRGELHLGILEDGRPYSGPVKLLVEGEPVLEEEVRKGYLQYRGVIREDGRVELLLHGKSYLITVPHEGFLPGWVKPYHLALAVLVLLSAVFSALVRSRERMTVTIDIPRVWDRERTRARASDILEVFELYNRRMRWNHLPLTLEEVQKGLYLFGVAKGYPDMGSVEGLLDREMNISTPHLERRVTDDLSVASAHGYYAPNRWEKDYQSVEHLAMIRASYEWLISKGIEAKPLTLPSYKEGYPDLLAVATSQVFKHVLGATHPEGEVVIYVECETGKKPGADAREKLLKTLQEKMNLVVERPVEQPAQTTQSPGTAGSTGEDAAKEEEKFRITKTLLLILSPVLYEAYEALVGSKEEEHEKILELKSEKKLFAMCISDLASA